MDYGYTIIHVPNVPKAVEFYEKAFGLTKKMMHKNEHYAEMNTGTTTVAFASHEHKAMDIEGYDLLNRQPHGYELVFITNNIQKAYERALTHGAIGLVKPVKKPWNQTIAYVRDLNGALVELATPIEKKR